MTNPTLSDQFIDTHYAEAKALVASGYTARAAYEEVLPCTHELYQGVLSLRLWDKIDRNLGAS